MRIQCEICQFLENTLSENGVALDSVKLEMIKNLKTQAMASKLKDYWA